VTIERSQKDKDRCVVRYFREGRNAESFEYQADEDAVVDVGLDVSRFIVEWAPFIGRLHEPTASKRLVSIIRQRQRDERAHWKAAAAA
jgi:hypothetical protein